jgi:hypothetical protein
MFYGERACWLAWIRIQPGEDAGRMPLSEDKGSRAGEGGVPRVRLGDGSARRGGSAMRRRRLRRAM